MVENFTRNVSDFYKKEYKKAADRTDSLQKTLNLISIARGIVFLAGIVVLVWLASAGKVEWGISAFFAAMVVFTALVQFHIKTKNILKYHSAIKFLTDNELKAVDYDFSNFYAGEEFVDSKHDYSFDLDIFGKKSVYQMICRANTNIGRTKLAERLGSININIEDIKKYQNAITELRNMPHWRTDFLVRTLLSTEKNEQNFSYFAFQRMFSKSSASDFSVVPEFTERKFSSLTWKIIAYLLPFLAFSITALFAAGYVADNLYVLFMLGMLTVAGLKLKYVNKVHQSVSNHYKLIEIYADLIRSIEKTPFKSDYLIEIQRKLYYDNKKASDIIKQLADLIKSLDYRLNLIVGMVLNAFLLWDIQIVMRLEKWYDKYGSQLDYWFDTIAEIETLISFATFSFNNPEYVFPQLSDSFIFKAKNMGHPLIAKQKIVKNDFEISNDNERIFVITGANMAGKSTFLRTLGLNLLLASSGSVVCADSLIVSPVRLITSIRITDSLQSDESYFYAELKRLKYIIDNIDNDKPTMLIIDEMLRGTNTDDKHNGSFLFLKKLLNFKAICFLATHDVELAKQAESFGNALRNYCFEAEIKNDELFFDYKLRHGISRNLNATFLMKKMNII